MRHLVFIIGSILLLGCIGGCAYAPGDADLGWGFGAIAGFICMMQSIGMDDNKLEINEDEDEDEDEDLI